MSLKLDQYKMYIDGAFVDASNGETFDNINPSTAEVLNQIPKATEKDLERALDAANRAQKEWKHVPSAERAEYLFKISDLILENKETFAKIISTEVGKVNAQAIGEVEATAEYFKYYAGWARKYEGEIIPSDRPNENILIFKKPLGVVAGILPWNYPFFLIARKVAPALLTGNTTVIKPSSSSPNNALIFAQLLEQINLPNGVVNILTGDRSLGSKLAESSKVDLVSITGSVGAGQSVMEAAAKNITKVSLELGGKAPSVVWKDADLDLTVKSIVDSRVINTGQVCNCTERVYVHEDIKEAFYEKITEAMSAVTYGNPIEDGSVGMGPLITESGLQSVADKVEQAKKDGARVLTGGNKDNSKAGYFFEPTVIVDTKNDMQIMQEEVFGPVLPIGTFSTLDEALEMANDSEFGLTSAIFTNDTNVMMKFINNMDAGEVYVNRESFESIQGFHAGWKKSGIGGADGRHGLEEFLATTVAYIDYDDKV
ncbi:aldehyde dehydrogenase [Marinilactibacillus sp. GCM10026970]|uniref:aldehyde dehydrogenase n=1 Tax=Marinilactibacillus sp. GCM10026970 TaxID=3252642 RepID=UPI003615845B